MCRVRGWGDACVERDRLPFGYTEDRTSSITLKGDPPPGALTQVSGWLALSGRGTSRCPFVEIAQSPVIRLNFGLEASGSAGRPAKRSFVAMVSGQRADGVARGNERDRVGARRRFACLGASRSVRSAVHRFPPRGVAMVTHAEAVRTAVDAWNEHDRERYIAAYRTDVALHGFPEGVVDAASLGDFFAGMWASVPDAHVSLDDVLAEDDRAAARLTLSGTHEGELMGSRPATSQSRSRSSRSCASTGTG